MKQKLVNALAQLLLGILLILGAVFPTTRSSAQGTLPQMEVNAAFDGYFKYGEWLPIWVLLENQGGDLDGEIRVPVQSSQGQIVYAAPVTLPSGSRKRFPIYVLPNNFSRELQVQLVSGGKTILTKSVSVRPQANITYFVGLLAPERGALSLINGVQLIGQERSKVLIDLAAGDLPDRGEALRSFDLIVMNDSDTSSLQPEQADALLAWVNQGGQLVLGGGPGGAKTLSGLPDVLLPAQIQNTYEISTGDLEPISAFTKQIPFEGSGRFITSQVSPIEGSEILVGTKSAPLVIQKKLGAGKIQISTLDLSGIPFNGWPGTQAFWEALIGSHGSYSNNMPFDVSPRQYRANSLFYALSRLPSLDLPSVQWIIVILVVFILFVGPLNYFILRRLRKMHLAWITIPVITILFTAGSFGIGYGMRGNDLILNKIAIVQLSSGGSADVTSYIGLFSPRQQNYKVIVSGQGLLSPMSGYEGDAWGANPGTSSGGEMVFTQGQPATVRGLSVNQWAMQSFMAEGTWENFGGFESELALDGEVLSGFVQNNSQYTLTDAAVIMNNRFHRLGDIQPGEQKEVNLGLSNIQSDRFGPPLSYRLYQENYTGGPLPRLVELKTNIVSSVFENTPWMKTMSSVAPMAGVSTAQEAILIGWLDQAPPSVEIENNSLSYQTTALVIAGLDYSLPNDGFLSIPPGLIPGSLTKMPVNSGTCGYSNSVSMGRGTAEFEFQIPENLPGMKVDRLKLAFYQDNTMQAMPDISIYHWETGAWDAIQDPIQGTNLISDAQKYIDTNGKVLIQVDNASDMFSCVYLDLGLEAELIENEGG